MMVDHTKRFLVIRLSSIGDIVHALPAVAALAEAFPRAEIHWAIEARHVQLLQGNPFVRRVIRLDTLGWRSKVFAAETMEMLIRAIAELRETRYDAAIDFQGLLKSGLIAWLSRSGERVGFSENWLREPGAGLFYTERVTPRGRRHVIEMNLALVERLGARFLDHAHWQFPLPRTEEDDRYVEHQLALLDAREFILINPGGGWKAKRWAPENYVELIRKLGDESAWKFLLTGSPDEEGMIRTILERASSPRAAYIPSTIVQLISLVRRARLFVGGDTGPLHLAAAAGTPIVAIYSADDPLNKPERNGPFRPEDITLSNRNADPQSAAWDRNDAYLWGVSVDSVLAAVRERLERAYG